MHHNKSHPLFRYGLGLLLFLLPILTGAPPLLAHNEPPDRPRPGLPERLEVDCRKLSLDCDNQTDERGAHILLLVKGTEEDAWTVVQWQDGAGGWNDVEGWRGTLTHGQVRWFVKEADLGKGPFRWQVEFTQPVTHTLVSDLFMLPDTVGDKVTVTIVQQ